MLKFGKTQGSFINLTCVAISLPGLPIDVDWFHKNKVFLMTVVIMMKMMKIIIMIVVWS